MVGVDVVSLTLMRMLYSGIPAADISSYAFAAASLFKGANRLGGFETKTERGETGGRGGAEQKINITPNKIDTEVENACIEISETNPSLPSERRLASRWQGDSRVATAVPPPPRQNDHRRITIRSKDFSHAMEANVGPPTAALHLSREAPMTGAKHKRTSQIFGGPSSSLSPVGP